MSGEPPIVSVSGGAGGTEARYDDILRLAGIFDASGDDLRSHAWDVKGLLADGDLLASAILSPLTFAEAEAAVFGATVGPSGLGVFALGIEADALIMQTSVTAYRLADDAVHQAFEVIDYLGGYALGFALPGLVVLGGIGALGLATNPLVLLYLHQNPDALPGALEDVEGFVEDNPELIQHLINGGGGLTDGLIDALVPLPPAQQAALLDLLGIDPVHATTGDAAGELSQLFVDGEHQVAEGGSGEPRTLVTPGSVEDLMRNLRETNNGGDGEIDIQQIGEGDDARYIVNLPGTDDWVGDPSDVRDLGSNLRLVAGQDTVYSRGIMEAMERAGIPPGAPVMLTGHSQGGMTAAHLAADPAFQDQYDVRHVVTAGAPTAQVPHIPDGTQVLSLENSGDVVPLLDGEDNPDQPNRTTVRFDDTTGSVGGNHDLDRYISGGSAVDGSGHDSLTETIAQLEADGFLVEEASTTETYTITRRPQDP